MTKIIFDGQLVDERYYFYPQRSSEEIVNNAQPIGISDGENLIYSRTGERIISVQYHVYEEKLRNVERFLAKTFVLKRQATLIFSDEPDEVWDVVVNDKPTIVKNGAGISGVIEFLVPSGVSHSIKSTTVTPDTDGKITVGYQGTATAYPVITATMKSDNGLVAFANDKGGYLQFGNSEETDGAYKPLSDRVVSVPLVASDSGFTANSGVKQYPLYGGNGNKNLMVGSFSYNDSGATPVYADQGETYWDNGRWVGAGSLWHGPSLSKKIPKSSANTNTGGFIWKTRFDWATDVWKMGRVEFTLSNAGKVIANATVLDDSNANMMYIATYCMGQEARQGTSLNRKDFSDGEYEIRFERTSDGGQIQLTKVGGPSFVVPLNFTDYQGTAIDEITIWTQKFGNQDSAGIKIKSTSFEWLNVETLVDVPNRWGTGDMVKIDIANRKIYVNDVLDNSLQKVGNQWESFALQPGQTVIQPVASSWATMYDCKLTYREAWL